MVFYGLAFEKYWTQIARAQFAETAIKNVAIAKRGSTLFAIVPHPVAHGLSRDYFFGVGNMLSTQSGWEPSFEAPRADSSRTVPQNATQNTGKTRVLERPDENEIVWSGEKNRREDDYFQGVILSSDRVRLLVEPSDRPGARGESLRRKTNAYVNTPLTVQDYLRRGLWKVDLAWDYQRKFISIVDEGGSEIRENPARASVSVYLATRNGPDRI